MKVILLLVLLVGLVASPAIAAVGFWSGPPPSRAVRIEQATEWREGFRKLDQQVPTLSPSEAAWLKREFDDQLASNAGRFTSRAIAAMKSREYQIRVVREGLDPIVRTLDAILMPADRSLQDEVRDWTRLAVLIMDLDLWQSATTLVEQGILKPEINGVKTFYSENHTGSARQVLHRVVLPFFERRLQ